MMAISTHSGATDHYPEAVPTSPGPFLNSKEIDDFYASMSTHTPQGGELGISYNYLSESPFAAPPPPSNGVVPISHSSGVESQVREGEGAVQNQNATTPRDGMNSYGELNEVGDDSAASRPSTLEESEGSPKTSYLMSNAKSPSSSVNVSTLSYSSRMMLSSNALNHPLPYGVPQDYLSSSSAAANVVAWSDGSHSASSKRGDDNDGSNDYKYAVSPSKWNQNNPLSSTTLMSPSGSYKSYFMGSGFPNGEADGGVAATSSSSMYNNASVMSNSSVAGINQNENFLPDSSFMLQQVSSRITFFFRKFQRHVRPLSDFFGRQYFDLPHRNFAMNRVASNVRYFLFNYLLILLSIFVIFLFVVPSLFLLLAVYLLVCFFIDLVGVEHFRVFNRSTSTAAILHGCHFIFCLLCILMAPVMLLAFLGAFLLILLHAACHVGQKYEKLREDEEVLV